MNRTAIAALTLAAVSAPAGAQEITVSFENLLAADGTAFTPVFLGLHDGSFDLFNPGGTASAGLEAVAEVGQTGLLTSEFNAAVSGGQATTTSTGPILGGGSASASFSVTNALENRFLTFATMVVPTNDLFIGNGNPQGIEVFDAAGNFNGPITIEIFGSNVWDAGTEVNNADDGAAFLNGINGAAGTEEGGTIRLFVDVPGYIGYLDSLVGRTTAPGFDIGSTFRADTAIARLTVVPAPASLALAPLAGLVAVRRRR